MKRSMLFAALSGFLLAGDERKPTDAAIAAYFRADSNLAAQQANQDKLIEDIRKALADSTAKQVKAAMAVTAAFAEIQAQCGGKVDMDALQKTGDMKCAAKSEDKTEPK